MHRIGSSLEVTGSLDVVGVRINTFGGTSRTDFEDLRHFDDDCSKDNKIANQLRNRELDAIRVTHELHDVLF